MNIDRMFAKLVYLKIFECQITLKVLVVTVVSRLWIVSIILTTAVVIVG